MGVPLQSSYRNEKRRDSAIPSNKSIKEKSISALCRHSSDNRLEDFTEQNRKNHKNKQKKVFRSQKSKVIQNRNSYTKKNYNSAHNDADSISIHNISSRSASPYNLKQDLNASWRSGGSGSSRKPQEFTNNLLRPPSGNGLRMHSTVLLTRRKRPSCHSARSRDSTQTGSEAEHISLYNINPAWREFQEEVKLLDLKYDTLETLNTNDTPKLTGVKRGVLDLPGSEQFTMIMKNFTSRFQQRPLLGEEVTKPIQTKATVRKKKKSSITRVGLALNEDMAESEEESEPTIEFIVNKSLCLAAKRGWGMIRRQVKEMSLEKKSKKSNFNWNLIRQHIGNISNVQRARMELYDKYIKKPDAWLGNFTNKLPESFINLHQHNIWRRRARRPRTAIPVIAQKIPENYEEYIENILEKIRPRSSVQ